MLLRREVQNVRRNKTAIQIRLTKSDLFALATKNVIIEHIRKPLLEFKGHTLPHHTYSVDSVYQGLSISPEEVANLDTNLVVFSSHQKNRSDLMVTLRSIPRSANPVRAVLLAT